MRTVLLVALGGSTLACTSVGTPTAADSNGSSGSTGSAVAALGTAVATSAPGTPSIPDSVPPSPKTKTLFAVIGDYGQDYGEAEKKVADLVKARQPDFVVTVGDNNYPGGSAETIDANIGKYYGDFIGSYRGRYGRGSKENRFWPSLGNHDWGDGDIGPYLDYFVLPGVERYYDVEAVPGLIHLFALDSDPHEPDGTEESSKQGAWFRKAARAATACFRLAYFHHPAYSSSQHGSSGHMRWKFKDAGMDVVLAGHDHTYERSDVDGLPYLVVGLGGAPEYDFPSPIPESKVRFNEDYGALFVTVELGRMTLELATIGGKTVDRFEVKKTCLGVGSAGTSP